MIRMWAMNTKEIGNIGEGIACKFLIKNNFTIVERNYLKKWGEIDIVATKDRALYFFEVKSMTVKRNGWEGMSRDRFRAEENVHIQKQRRLKRAIGSYLAERRYGPDTEFLFSVVVVHMDMKTRRGRVSLIENVIL